MNLGIIGTGHMGGTLGGIWAQKGHKVFFGSRDVRKAAGLIRAIGENVGMGSYEEAVRFGEVILLATPWPATQEALQSCGSLAGKILIDCTNPLKPDLSGLTTTPELSGGEMVAQWAPGAKVVKAFNSINYAVFKSPNFGQQNATMFYCGDDGPAKLTVAGLGKDFGLDPIDCGPLSASGMLEWLCMLWIHLAFKQGLPDSAFKLLRR
jgi:predicted dinucleotide-binding enzyme